MDDDWLEYSGQDTDELLALRGKYRADSLTAAFAEALEAKEEGADLSHEEHSVLAVEALEREVNNGGFHAFFCNSSRRFLDVAADALSMIGCPRLASVTSEAVALLDVDVEDEDALEERLEDEELEEALGKLDERYYEVRTEEPVEERLLAWIEEHRQAIRIGLAPPREVGVQDDRVGPAVHECLDELERIATPAQKELVRLARRHRVVPLLIQEGGFVGLSGDGLFLSVSHADFVGRDMDDLTANLARIQGAERYPGLAFLMPERDESCVVCPGCRGSGSCEFGHPYNCWGSTCQCGGLGWLPKDFVSFETLRADEGEEPGHTVDTRCDIAGPLYASLLRFAAERGHTASLVMRADKIISLEARAAFERLAPHAIHTAKVTRWPGTIVGAEKPMAKLIRFPVCEATLEALLDTAQSVFSWRQPWLPEDLTLYDEQGNDWFVSVAHEAEWSVDVRHVDVQKLREIAPQLVLT